MTAKTKERKYSVFDFDKLGKKALVAPFCLVIVLACVLSLAVAPLLQASPHDVSLVIVNLDEGVSTPAGTANADAMLASQLTGEEDEAPKESATAMAAIAKAAATASGTETAADAVDAAEAPATSASAAMADSLTWETFDTEDELHAQLDGDNVFGGIVIPADFTAQQLAAKSGDADKPHPTVYLNMGKNPQVASSLQTAMAQSLASAGVDADIEMVNNADVAPQAHLGQGVRTIVYCGQTPGMTDASLLLAFAVIGATALLLAAGLETAKQAKGRGSAPAKHNECLLCEGQNGTRSAADSERTMDGSKSTQPRKRARRSDYQPKREDGFEAQHLFQLK